MVPALPTYTCSSLFWGIFCFCLPRSQTYFLFAPSLPSGGREAHGCHSPVRFHPFLKTSLNYMTTEVILLQKVFITEPQGSLFHGWMGWREVRSTSRFSLHPSWVGPASAALPSLPSEGLPGSLPGWVHHVSQDRAECVGLSNWYISLLAISNVIGVEFGKVTIVALKKNPIFFMCISVYVCAGAHRGWKRCQIPWNWSYRLLWLSCGRWEQNPVLVTRALNVLNQRAIPPAW